MCILCDFKRAKSYKTKKTNQLFCSALLFYQLDSEYCSMCETGTVGLVRFGIDGCKEEQTGLGAIYLMNFPFPLNWLNLVAF